MRRRGEPPAQPKPEERPDPPPRPGGVDWVSNPPDAPATKDDERNKLTGSTVIGRKQGELCAAAMGFGSTAAEVPNMLGEGDQLLVTIGKETYYPGGAQKFNGFEVGPMSVTVTIRKNETAAQAWVRGRSVLENLFEAELVLRIDEFVAHLDQARKTVRGE